MGVRRRRSLLRFDCRKGGCIMHVRVGVMDVGWAVLRRKLVGLFAWYPPEE
jgi:hypothetical protein